MVRGGLRSLGPVWSRANAFGHGVPFISPSLPGHRARVSATPGVRWCARCAELGHPRRPQPSQRGGLLGRGRASDAGPLVASHSAAHALCPASRNLTDAQLDAIGARRTGRDRLRLLRSCGRTSPTIPDTPIALIAEHARYVADRIGAAPRRARLRLRRRDDPAGRRATRPECRGSSTRSAAAGFAEPELRGDRLGELAAGARGVVARAGTSSAAARRERAAPRRLVVAPVPSRSAKLSAPGGQRAPGYRSDARLLDPQPVEHPLVGPPVAAHADRQLEVHVGAQLALDRLAGRRCRSP